MCPVKPKNAVSALTFLVGGKGGGGGVVSLKIICLSGDTGAY
jgi:hypothetical protein